MTHFLCLNSHLFFLRGWGGKGQRGMISNLDTKLLKPLVVVKINSPKSVGISVMKKRRKKKKRICGRCCSFFFNFFLGRGVGGIVCTYITLNDIILIQATYIVETCIVEIPFSVYLVLSLSTGVCFFHFLLSYILGCRSCIVWYTYVIRGGPRWLFFLHHVCMYMFVAVLWGVLNVLLQNANCTILRLFPRCFFLLLFFFSLRTPFRHLTLPPDGWWFYAVKRKRRKKGWSSPSRHQIIRTPTDARN